MRLSALGAAPRRGQPLRALLLLAFCWIGLRFVLWENPWPISNNTQAEEKLDEVRAPDQLRLPNDGGLKAFSIAPEWRVPVIQRVALVKQLSGQNKLPSGNSQLAPNPVFATVEVSRTFPPTASETSNRPITQVIRQEPVTLKTNRLHIDSWLYWRDGNNSVGQLANGPAQLGGSQAGIIFAYHFDPKSKLRPAAYIRATQAIGGSGEGEVAVGMKARPISTLPVDVHAEMRLLDAPAGTEVRPAIVATGGFDDLPVTHGVSARGYGQAGYVGGRYETGFVDGRIVTEKSVTSSDRGKISIGAGIWGGAQRGAARLDVGPSASLVVPVKGASLRLSADYRIRIAGVRHHRPDRR